MESYKFYLYGNGKWNDIIREYLDKAFKPLVDFIVDSLSMEMIEMGKCKTRNSYTPKYQ